MTTGLINFKLLLPAFGLVKRPLAGFLVGMILSISLGWQSVSAQTTQDTQNIEKARATVQSLGTGTNARVKVKHKDKRTLRGYISTTTTDNFTLIDPNNGVTETIAYSDVKSVSEKKSGLSPLGWAVLGGVAAAVIVVAIIVKPAFCDGC